MTLTKKKMTPLEVLETLKNSSGAIPHAKAEAYLKEIRKIRRASSEKRWNDGWGKYLKEKSGKRK